MRTLSWIIICLLVAIAALQAGYIVRDCVQDDTRDRVTRIEARQTDLSGRVVALETIDQRRREGE